MFKHTHSYIHTSVEGGWTEILSLSLSGLQILLSQRRLICIIWTSRLLLLHISSPLYKRKEKSFTVG